MDELCLLHALAEVTAESVKAAFKVQAMQLHPDRVGAAGGTAEAQQAAHVQFLRLQVRRSKLFLQV